MPQEPAALEALIATHAGAATEAVALAETPAAAEELDPKRLVGVPRCNGIARAWLWHEAGTGRLKGLWPGANVRIGLGRAEALFAQGRFPEARAALAAARKAPAGLHQAPLFELAIAESYARQEREEEARLVLGVVLGRHPSNADAWAELAALARRVGRRSEGAGHLVRALALEPGSPRLWDALRGDFFVSIEPAVLPPAQPADGDPSASRWQRVLDGADPAAAAAPESEALAYARCKSAFRQSPELRQAITGQAEPRWLWSPAEETVCTRLWLARYRENRDAGQRPPHPRLEALLEVELRGQLAERALFDVGGQVHRHLSAFLDRGRRERLFQFVENERLGRRQGGGWLF